MGVLMRMDRTGDSKFMWNSQNADEVSAARKQFDDLKKKGFMAYKVDPANGAKAEQIRTFDPELEKIIMAPPMQGG